MKEKRGTEMIEFNAVLDAVFRFRRGLQTVKEPPGSVPLPVPLEVDIPRLVTGLEGKAVALEHLFAAGDHRRVAA